MIHIDKILYVVHPSSCLSPLFLGPNYYVRVLSTLDRELLKPNSSVALHKHSNALVDVLPPEADSSIAMLTAEEKPDVSYSGKQPVCMNLETSDLGASTL